MNACIIKNSISVRSGGKHIKSKHWEGEASGSKFEASPVYTVNFSLGRAT